MTCVLTVRKHFSVLRAIRFKSLCKRRRGLSFKLLDTDMLYRFNRFKYARIIGGLQFQELLKDKNDS